MLSSPVSRPRTYTYAHYEPHTPSLLRSSSPMSSPTSSPTYTASARRRNHYKATTPSNTGSPRRKKSSAYVKKPSTVSSSWESGFIRGTPPRTEPQTASPQNDLLRERFRQRCFERAQKAREAKVRSGRKSARHLSDGENIEIDMSDDEEGFINDDFYARIMLAAERKRSQDYRVSFQHDVGCSLDPAVEDPAEWERELHASADDGARPPSEYDEDEADELAALAEDEAYWEALGDADCLDDLDDRAADVHIPRPTDDPVMDTD